jgi:hypothetical protein
MGHIPDSLDDLVPQVLEAELGAIGGVEDHQTGSVLIYLAGFTGDEKNVFLMQLPA